MISQDFKNINGLLIVDKPAGVTSAQTINHIKKCYKVKKIGHAGTLDPFATGVLVCCLNKGTKLSKLFLADSKTYIATICLGIETDTYDNTGKIQKTSPVKDISRDRILSVLKGFEGVQDQAPPVFSALKHNGVPLYKLARKGQPVQKPARKIQVFYLQLLEINLPFVKVEVSCTKGTYIRSLAADIGHILGCGGHLESLRRIRSGYFVESEAIKIDSAEIKGITHQFSLEKNTHVIPMGKALRGIPEIRIKSEMDKKIKYGQPIFKTDINLDRLVDYTGNIKIKNNNDELLAIMELNPSQTQLKYSCVFID